VSGEDTKQHGCQNPQNVAVEHKKNDVQVVQKLWPKSEKKASREKNTQKKNT